jgi:hypothetical protein
MMVTEKNRFTIQNAQHLENRASVWLVCKVEEMSVPFVTLLNCSVDWKYAHCENDDFTDSQVENDTFFESVGRRNKVAHVRLCRAVIVTRRCVERTEV